jgi:hypothetical protein
MLKTTGRFLGMIVLGSILVAPLAMATDYSTMTTAELSEIRGTLYNATEEERMAFRQEWQSRLNEMTPAERQQYAGPPANAPRLGSQDGTGLGGGIGSGKGGGNNGSGGNGNGNGGGNGGGNGNGNGNGGKGNK